ncbi:DNA-binding protein [Streptomyces sp. XD-27]|uniref:DNA-binding protein n=1 Tax=Streptomyces sp. XD-27 TaxID=3062779 RepID=UPI0026F40A14|nr:DNA-binding protein [Streptomyces sp. XD-27]WKX70023.1 DNA-binding protein [Streptomyces sp. XD-27]
MIEVEPDESPHLTVKQLAKRWHTTPQAIYMMRHRRKAPRGFKRGREVLFPLADVAQHEAAAQADDPKSNPDLDPTRIAPESARPRRRRMTRRSLAA